MKPKIYNNFLDKSYSELLNKTIFENSDFSWYYLNNISGWRNVSVDGVNFSKNQSGFYHVAYADGMQQSNLFLLLLPFIHRIEEKFDVTVKNLMRVRIGMNLNIGEVGSHYPHTDLDVPNYTLLYYIDESDGDTIFYKGSNDNLKVDFKNPHTQNQAVLFDGLTMHSSSSPIKYDKRTTININFA